MPLIVAVVLNIAETKVSNQRTKRRGLEEDVRRLKVPMHDALAMSMINCVCDHYEHPKDFWKVWAVSLNQLIKANILPKPGSGPGLATESTLRLNRLPLIERRSERLHVLNRQLHLLVEVADANKRAVIRRDLELHELSGDKEFAGMARAYIREELRRLDGQS